MKISNREQDGIQIVELGGKVMGDPGESELSETINGFIEHNKIYVVLDLSEVLWMNSTGLGICLGGMTRLRNRGGDLMLVGLPETVKTLLEKCRILRMFRCFDTIEEAQKSF
jgi:anti-sigma B factor antagonist